MAIEMTSRGSALVWHSARMGPNAESSRPAQGLGEADDATLVGRVRERDEAALEELVRRYERPLFALAYRVAGGDQYAQDVVQEVFVTLWRDADRFDPARGAVSSWLLTMARFKAIDLLRRETGAKRRHVEADLSLEPATDDVHQEVWLRARQDVVRAALRELGDTQREAVSLAFFDGLTHVEVAEALGIPLGTAKTRIRDGLIRLRRVMGDSLADSLPSA
ncbi:MAG: sigma-70 family RNA polymerase sigma factor, partial [Candidatus Limnocylindrales bacterium]